MSVTAGPAPRLSEDDCRLEDLIAVLAAGTDPVHYPYAADPVQEVLVHDAAAAKASCYAFARAAAYARIRQLASHGGHGTRAGDQL